MTDKLTRTRIEEIKRLAEETNPKEWDCDIFDDDRKWEIIPMDDRNWDGEAIAVLGTDEDGQCTKNAMFIAKTDPQTVLALIEQLEAWREAALELAALWNGHHGQTLEMAERALARARSLECEGGE